MLYFFAFAATQSSALMTLLVRPDPSASSTFRLTSVAPGATPVKAVALARDDARNVRRVPQLVVAHTVGPGEVEAGGHLLLDRLVVRAAGIDERHAHAAAGHGARARERARPRLVGADGLVGHGHHRAHIEVAREMIHRGIRAQGRELRALHRQHGAGLQPLLDDGPVPRRHRVNRSRVGLKDHVPRIHRTCRQRLRQVAREPSLRRRHRGACRQAQDEDSPHGRRRTDAPEEEIHCLPPISETSGRKGNTVARASDSIRTRWDPPSVLMVINRPSRIRL